MTRDPNPPENRPFLVLFALGTTLVLALVLVLLLMIVAR